LPRRSPRSPPARRPRTGAPTTARRSTPRQVNKAVFGVSPVGGVLAGYDVGKTAWIHLPPVHGGFEPSCPCRPGRADRPLSSGRGVLVQLGGQSNSWPRPGPGWMHGIQPECAEFGEHDWTVLDDASVNKSARGAWEVPMPRANDFSATSMSEPGREKLRVAGCILSGLTVAVIGVGIFVVQGHLTGRTTFG
jgi:hypothetical protein